MYKLSIITINRNNASGLRKTIESVVSQTCTDFEYIVIDGASTDNSVEVIKEYADKITYWLSEPDNGIYNAMNKGILKATGEYLLFLNSGDWLVDNNIICEFINEAFDKDVIGGNMYLEEQNKLLLVKSPNLDVLDFNFFFQGSIYHQATFFKNKLFSEYGLYDEQYKIIADFDFLFRVTMIHNSSYKYFDRIISVFPLNGISALKENIDLIAKDREKIFLKHMPKSVYLSYKNAYEELIFLRKEYRDYSNLKNGKFKLLINLIQTIKKKSKK